jgi:hypothetical protein
MRRALPTLVLAGGLVCAAWPAPARAEGIVWTLTCLTNSGASTTPHDSAKDCNEHRGNTIEQCADPKKMKLGPRAFTDICKHPEHGRQCVCTPHTAADASGSARMWSRLPGESAWSPSAITFTSLGTCEATRPETARLINQGRKTAGLPGRVTIEHFV